MTVVLTVNYIESFNRLFKYQLNVVLSLSVVKTFRPKSLVKSGPSSLVLIL